MAAILLSFQHKQNVNMQNVFTERLLAEPDDVFQFNDKTIVSRYRLLLAMILHLAKQLKQALERPTLRHWALPADKKYKIQLYHAI